MKIKTNAYFILSLFFFLFTLIASAEGSSSKVLQVGKPFPNAKLKSYGTPDVEIKDLIGKIKIISIVPQLNTPTCDEQTHQFSETNGGLDKHIDIITVSTNTAEDQYRFSMKSGIDNIIFLSDKPDYHFGKQTHLLINGRGILKRTVLVVDEKNIIRYVDFVPGGGLPNIKAALKAAKEILDQSKT